MAERSSQDRCLVAWGKTQAPPPPPTALDKVKGALAGTVSFFQAAVAGGFAATVMFPVDMAKTRMQACAQTEASVAAAHWQWLEAGKPGKAPPRAPSEARL